MCHLYITMLSSIENKTKWATNYEYLGTFLLGKLEIYWYEEAHNIHNGTLTYQSDILSHGSRNYLENNFLLMVLPTTSCTWFLIN